MVDRLALVAVRGVAPLGQGADDHGVPGHPGGGEDIGLQQPPDLLAEPGPEPGVTERGESMTERSRSVITS